MMHRRQRHLNPARLGCQVVLDARFIGQANNTAVATWTGRTGTSINATQATPGNRPIYLDAALNGRPGVVFDGTDDFMSLGAGALGLTANTGSVWAMVVSVCSAIGDAVQIPLYISTVSSSTSRFVVRAADSSTRRATSLARRLDGDTLASTSSAGVTSSANITTVLSNYTGNQLACSLNGGTASTNTYSSGGGDGPTSASLVANIGGQSGTSNRLNGAIGSVLIMSPAPSASVIKRLRHCAAYQFRIKSQ